VVWSRDKILKVLAHAGFELKRHGANHDIYHREGHPNPVPVPRHRGDLRPGTADKILKLAGLTIEQAEDLA
jgi:predicted RNA binding protein YcfA (HicA-like mRNA interferase family)